VASLSMEDQDLPRESVTFGGLARASLAVVAFCGGIALTLSLMDRLHLDLDAFPLMFAGVTVLVLCYFRPSWFWDSWRGALLLRQRWGDSVASSVYIILAVVLLGVAGSRELLAAEDLKTCHALLEAAQNQHQRVRALRTVPRPAIPSMLRFLAPYHPRTCEQYIPSGVR